jgi:hypothetical protein
LKAQGVGFRDQGAGCRVCNLGLGFGFRVWGSGFGVYVYSLEFRVLKSRVYGLGFRV